MTDIKHLLVAAFTGAAIAYGLIQATTNNQDEKIIALESKIQDLEIALAQSDEALAKRATFAFPQQHISTQVVAHHSKQASNPENDRQPAQFQNEYSAAEVEQKNLKTLKDLETNSVNDPRSFVEKANDLLANPSKDNIAVVSKSIFDLASDRESLPDYALQSLYHNQTDEDLKRVIAQVASLRGTNELMQQQIIDAQSRLKSDTPSDRQKALTNLAKTHNANAANAIAPFLQDPDINVKLDALLALRATGNQTHITYVEKLLNDPDPAVSSLAKDVVTNLRNLSDTARVTLASADIAAELP